MSGLSDTERVGCLQILKLLPKGDLLSLCDTVTNKLIAPENDTGKVSVRYRKLTRVLSSSVTFIFSYPIWRDVCTLIENRLRFFFIQVYQHIRKKINL